MNTINGRLKFAAFTILIALAVALAYTFLHEAGHALVGLIFGGQIGEFNVNFLTMGAHVNIAGQFTRVQDAVINVSGAGLPFLVWLVLILALPKKGGLLVLWTKFIASSATLCSLLAWVIIPFLYLRNIAPAGDDVTQFIANSELPALLVAFTALGVFVAGWLLFSLRMTGLQSVGRVFASAGGKPMLVWRWVVAGGIVVGVLVSAGMLVGSTLGGSVAPSPKGYNLAARVDLSGGNMDAQSITRFTLAVAGDAVILLRVTGIESAYIDVTLVPARGAPLPLLHGEEFSSRSADSPYQFRLPAGDYQILLTSRESLGILEVYLRLP